jgi:hypothetical protein
MGWQGRWTTGTDIKVALHQELLPLVNDLQNILNWWKSLGASSIRFQPVAPVDSLKMENLLLTPDFLPFLDRSTEILEQDTRYVNLSGTVLKVLKR